MSNKEYHIGKWNEILPTFDAERIWKELNRIVAKNHLARNHVKYEGLVDHGKFNYFVDLTQELFVVLLEKNRFQHYLDTEMSDVEIEIEISQLEISNMMSLKLKKRYPERFRMARRISTILKNDELFYEVEQTRKKRLSDKLFVLSSHITYIGMNATDEMVTEATSNIKQVLRDRRFVGVTGDTQIIISNTELTNTIYLIMSKVQFPMSVKQIRNVVMSKLNLMDVDIKHVEEMTREDDDREFDIADTRANPEQVYINKDFEKKINDVVDSFMWNLSKSVKHKEKRYKLACRILYIMYFRKPQANQFEVSRILNISDASVSDYRKIIEVLLKGLNISTMSEAKVFQESLKRRLERDNEK